MRRTRPHPHAHNTRTSRQLRTNCEQIASESFGHIKTYSYICTHGTNTHSNHLYCVWLGTQSVHQTPQALNSRSLRSRSFGYCVSFPHPAPDKRGGIKLTTVQTGIGRAAEESNSLPFGQVSAEPRRNQTHYRSDRYRPSRGEIKLTSSGHRPSHRSLTSIAYGNVWKTKPTFCRFCFPHDPLTRLNG